MSKKKWLLGKHHAVVGVFKTYRFSTVPLACHMVFCCFLIGQEQGFPLEKQVLYCLSHTSSPFCFGFEDGISPNCLPSLASNLHPADRSLPSKVARIASVSH
jgi:hypothetical protein